MKILISTPNINLIISKTVNLFKKLNSLDSFWTTLLFSYKFKFLKKRYYKDIDFKFVKLIFFKELMRKICEFFNLKKFYLNEDNIFSIESINIDLDKKVSKYLSKSNDIGIIYSYEDCSKESFKVAKLKNIKTIYDLTSPYWLYKKKILDDEKKLHPDWNLSSTEIMSDKKCKFKDEELELSDKVIVASNFTAKSLDLFQSNKKLDIKIIPYGIDIPVIKKLNQRKENQKFKIFFAGRPTLSKGIQYLIKSLNQLDFPWEIEVAGSIPERPSEISKKLNTFFLDERCKFLGQISNYDLLIKMKNSHVFLFPSLFEGFGQVILEAFSCGLPVITTFNTAGLDLIDNGKNGFLTEIRDSKKITEILYKLYENEDLRRSIADKTFLTLNNYSWDNYQLELSKIIKF